MTKAVLPDDYVAADLDRLEQIRVLEAAVHTCQQCALAAGRTHAVPGEGNLNTLVMFVGEGPGLEEDRQGRPFVGRSGQFLADTLKKVGIDRSAVYITNVVKCRPPENRDPLPDELESCAGYLDRQVELINPRIIVTLGRFSMRRWFPDGSITRVHGQIRNIGRGRVAIAMFHPAAALRNPQWQVEFERDMQVLPKLIERARRANEAALRGDALAAGMPHPGDSDYQPPTESLPERPAPPLQQPAPAADDTVERTQSEERDSLNQLRLF